MSASHSSQELPERLKHILRAFLIYYANKEPPQDIQEMNMDLLEHVALKGEKLDDHPNFEILKFAVYLHLNRKNPQIEIDMQLGRSFLQLCENSDFVKSIKFLEDEKFDLKILKKLIYKQIAQDHYDVFASEILGIINLNPDDKISKIDKNDFEALIYSEEDGFSLDEFRESALEIMTEALIAKKGNTHELSSLAVEIGSLFYDPNQEDQVLGQINKHYGINKINLSTPLSNIAQAIRRFYDFHEETPERINPKNRKNTMTREELQILRAYRAEQQRMTELAESKEAERRLALLVKEREKIPNLENLKTEIGTLSTELNSLKSTSAVFQIHTGGYLVDFNKNSYDLEQVYKQIQDFRARIENLQHKYAALADSDKDSQLNQLRIALDETQKTYIQARDYNLKEHLKKSIGEIIDQHPDSFILPDPILLAQVNFEQNRNLIDQEINEVNNRLWKTIGKEISQIADQISHSDDPEMTAKLQELEATELSQLQLARNRETDQVSKNTHLKLNTYNQVFLNASKCLSTLISQYEKINDISIEHGEKPSEKLASIADIKVELSNLKNDFREIIDRGAEIIPASNRLQQVKEQFDYLYNALQNKLNQSQMNTVFETIIDSQNFIVERFDDMSAEFKEISKKLDRATSLEELRRRSESAQGISLTSLTQHLIVEGYLKKINSTREHLDIELDDDQEDIYQNLCTLSNNLKHLSEQANDLKLTLAPHIASKERIEMGPSSFKPGISLKPDPDPHLICTLVLSNKKTAKLYGTSEYPVEDLALLPINSLSASAAIDQKTVPAAWIQVDSLAPGESWPEADLQFKAICLFFQYCKQCEANPETQGRNPPLKLSGDLPLAMLQQIIACCEATNKKFFFDGINIDMGNGKVFPDRSINGHNKFQIERTMRLIKDRPELAEISFGVRKGHQDNLKEVGDTIMKLARIDKPDYLSQFVKLGINPDQLQEYVHPKSGVSKTPWTTIQHKNDMQADAPQMPSDPAPDRKLSKRS